MSGAAHHLRHGVGPRRRPPQSARALRDAPQHDAAQQHAQTPLRLLRLRLLWLLHCWGLCSRLLQPWLWLLLHSLQLRLHGRYLGLRTSPPHHDRLSTLSLPGRFYETG